MPAFIGPTARRSATRKPPRPPRLDRAALQKLAASAGGPSSSSSGTAIDEIANALIDTGKRIAPSIGLRQDAEELYWYFLLLAAALILLGFLFVRDRAGALGFSSPEERWSWCGRRASSTSNPDSCFPGTAVSAANRREAVVTHSRMTLTWRTATYVMGQRTMD